MYRYIYKITCTAPEWEGKFYIGQRHYHGKNPYDDRYKGSGKLIKRYIKKHPKEYIKEIIAFYNTDEELNKAEYDLISVYLGTDNCLNIAEGGHGGFTCKHTEQQKLKWSKSRKDRKTPEVTKQKQSIAHQGCETWNKGKHYKLKICRKDNKEYIEIQRLLHLNKKATNITKNKMSESHKGAKYMTDGISKPVYVKPEYWGEFIDIGYHFGKK